MKQGVMRALGVVRALAINFHVGQHNGLVNRGFFSDGVARGCPRRDSQQSQSDNRKQALFHDMTKNG